MTAKELLGGAYVTLDQNYQIQKRVEGRSGQGITNVHEFKGVDNGGSLIVTSAPRYFTSPIHSSNHVSGWLRDGGFQEIDEYGRPVFTWWALDHLEPIESYAPHSIASNTNSDHSWDFLYVVHFKVIAQIVR